jgi:protein required for attachment to host cells
MIWIMRLAQPAWHLGSARDHSATGGAMTESIYVVVADSSHADIYLSQDKLHSLELQQTLEHAASRQTAQELESDRPGRAASSGRGYHGFGGDHDPQRQQAEVFARQLGHFLHQAHGEGRFAQLAIAAPPQFLGQLRQHLSKDCERVLLRTVDKHLGRLDASAVLAHFA